MSPTAPASCVPAVLRIATTTTASVPALMGTKLAPVRSAPVMSVCDALMPNGRLVSTLSGVLLTSSALSSLTLTLAGQPAPL